MVEEVGLVTGTWGNLEILGLGDNINPPATPLRTLRCCAHRTTQRRDATEARCGKHVCTRCLGVSGLWGVGTEDNGATGVSGCLVLAPNFLSRHVLTRPPREIRPGTARLQLKRDTLQPACLPNLPSPPLTPSLPPSRKPMTRAEGPWWRVRDTYRITLNKVLVTDQRPADQRTSGQGTRGQRTSGQRAGEAEIQALSRTVILARTVVRLPTRLLQVGEEGLDVLPAYGGAGLGARLQHHLQLVPGCQLALAGPRPRPRLYPLRTSLLHSFLSSSPGLLSLLSCTAPSSRSYQPGTSLE